MPAPDTATADHLPPPGARGGFARAGTTVIDRLQRRAVPVTIAVLILAVAVNVLAPFWYPFTAGEARATGPAQDSPAGTGWTGTGADIAYVVLDSSRSTVPDGSYRDALVDRLRAGTESVLAASALAADPLTAPLAVSDDGRTEVIEVQVNGAPGSADARRSIGAVRATVRAVPAPEGLRVYVSGPAAAAADTAAAADRQAPWLAVILAIALVVLIAAATRSLATTAALTAGTALAVAVALPVGLLVVGPLDAAGAAIALALSAGAALQASALLRRRHRRQGDAPGGDGTAGVIVGSMSVSAAGAAAVMFLDIGHLLGAGVAVGLSVIVSTVLCCATAPLWLARTTTHDGATRGPGRRRLRLVRAVYRHPAVALAGTALVFAAGLLQIPRLDDLLADSGSVPPRSGAERGNVVAQQHFGADRVAPISVVLRAGNDLRNPAGLIAVDRVARELMDLPRVTRVESAATPAGVPWPQATIAHQFGELNRHLQSQGLSAMAVADSVQSLPSQVAELDSAVDKFSADLAGSATNLSPVNNSLQALQAASERIQSTITDVSRYADPLRAFVRDNPHCPTDLVCSSAQRVLQPLDGILADTSDVLNSTRALPAGVSAAGQVLTSSSETLARIRAGLNDIRPLIDNLAATSGTAMPEATRASTFVNAMTTDLSINGGGGFYLPQSTIDAPEYGRVKDRLFSPDGHATRLLVYADGSPDREFAADVGAAIRAGTKFTTLTDLTADVAGSESFSPATDLRHLAGGALLLAAVLAALAGLLLRSASAAVAAAVSVLLVAVASAGLAALFVAHLVTDTSTPLLALVAAVPVAAGEVLWSAHRARRRTGAGQTADLPADIATWPLGAAVITWAVVVAAVTYVDESAVSYLAVAAAITVAVAAVGARAAVVALAGLRSDP